MNLHDISDSKHKVVSVNKLDVKLKTPTFSFKRVKNKFVTVIYFKVHKLCAMMISTLLQASFHNKNFKNGLFPSCIYLSTHQSLKIF